MAEKAEKAEKKVAKETKGKREDNSILIGKKETMAYVLGVITQFGDGKTKEVNVKARGRAISRAVDVVEIFRNKFAKDVKVKDIKIGTDKIKTQEGREMNVSSISICITK